MSQSEFDRLEQFVSRLLDKYDQLREENFRLAGLLRQKEDEVKSLEAEISSADSERVDITKRVKGLIDQIEEWEMALGGETARQYQKEQTAELIEENPEQDRTVVETQEERDSSAQQNLFNIERRINDFNS